jgi:multiple sugar transport system permease protein
MSQASNKTILETPRPKVFTFQYVLARVALYVVLVLGAVAMAFPFIWMLTTSFQSRQESLQARPVWFPNRLQPANWVSATRLGAQGGNTVWGGLEPGRTLKLELHARQDRPVRGDLRASVPLETSGASLFSQNTTTDTGPRVTVSTPRLEGENTVWDVTLKNIGSSSLHKLPLTINLPEGFTDPQATLPPDRTGRDDAGAVLDWSNVAPGALGYVFENYADALQAAPFGRYFLNSVITALVSVIAGTLIVCLAAFAFARIQFAGRDLAFTLILSSLVIPGEMLLVPNFVTVSRLGWTDTYQALVVPWVASVFGIFLLRQFFLSLPAELFEAATLDGATYGTMLTRIALPLARPGIATYAIFSFLGSWNALIWPLIVTSKQDMRTLQVGLQAFIGEAGSNYGQLMAASVMVILPIIVVFLLAQKQFIAGVARSGLK